MKSMLQRQLWKSKYKNTKDQVVHLQWQVQVLQAQAMESRAANKVTELENELEEVVDQGRSLYVEVYDTMKKELLVHFPREDFF